MPSVSAKRNRRHLMADFNWVNRTAETIRELSPDFFWFPRREAAFFSFAAIGLQYEF
jgi:hypothetical protein